MNGPQEFSPAATPEAEEAAPETVRVLLDQRARSHGSGLAFVYPESNEEVTYGKLQQRVVAAASWLAREGCRRGDCVAYALENGRVAVELYLASQYGGYVAVPLNPANGPEGLKRQLAHCGARILVVSGTDECSAELLSEPPEATVLAAASEVCAAWNDATPSTLPPVLPGDECVLNYTSGTSGDPKGVMMRHYKVLASARIHVSAHAQSEKDIGVLLLPLFHMNAQHVSVLSTLYCGGTLVVPRRFVASEFLDLVKQYGVTWFAAVPAMLSQLDQLSVADYSTKLRFGRCSSAPLGTELHRSIERKLGIPIIEAMGMTESGGTFFFNPLPPRQRKYGSVGIPMGYEVKVADEKGVELPVNTSGQILLRGEAVMDGYYKREGASFCGEWLKTGDVGYRDEDGYFYITGRDKDIVIKGGTNIAPREIEEVLLSHSGVTEAAATGVFDVLYGEEVVAFVVMDSPDGFDEKSLMDWCRRRLGVVKVPRRILRVNELPRNSMGKIKKNLLASEYARIQRNTARGRKPEQNKENQPRVSAPATFPGGDSSEPVLSELVQIWERVLEVSPVSPADNFFDLGGYSLSAVRVIDEIEEQFGISLSVSILLECRTVKDLARAISAGGREDKWQPLVPIKATGTKAPFFGFFAEDHVLFYYDLATSLDDTQPFYGVESPTLRRGESLPGSLKEMASLYLDHIRAVQPAGPYYLGGQCTGATLALEVAQQLRALGEHTGLLVIFDSGGPAMDEHHHEDRDWSFYLRRCLFHIRRGSILAVLSNKIKETWALAGLARARRAYLRQGSGSLSREGVSGDEDDTLDQRRPLEDEIKWINNGWKFRYKAAPYPGKVLLMQSTESIGRKKKQQGVERWNRVAGELEVVVAPGSHLSMFHHPNSEYMARTLQRFLNEAITN